MTDRSHARNVVLVFIAVQVGMVLSSLDATIVATALPTIGRDLGDNAQRAWVITAYLLAQVATMPIYGKLGDLYGRKRIFLFALGLFTIGSVSCGIAGTLEQLVVFRFVQGLGAGGIGVLAMAVLADVVPARQLGRWLGYQGAMFAVASLIGPLAGGLFVDHLTWRWAFYVNVPFAALSAVMVVRHLDVPYRKVRHAIDYLGSALLTVALAAVVLAASLGGREVGWASAEVVVLGAVAVVFLGTFAAHERRAREPVLPLTLLANRVVRVASLLNLTSGALFASGIYFIPVFLQQVAGTSATSSGMLLVPFMFTTAFATLIAGRRVETTGRYRVWPIVGSVFTFAGVVLLATLTQESAIWWAAGFGAVLGTGVGFIMQTSLLALQNGVEFRDLGVATSTAMLGRMLGVTLGASVLSAVYELRLDGFDGTRAATVAHAIPSVYVASIPVALVTILLAWRLPEHALREHASLHEGPVLPLVGPE